jgi:radical SAM superfamily enzyme YgiQ (UPF0313 family)
MLIINSSQKNALKIFQPFLPIFVPIGVGSLLAALKAENIDADYIDEQTEPDSLAKIQAFAAKMPKPYIFGFSVLTAAFKNALELSNKLRGLYPDCIIIFGGLHPTTMPDEVLAHKHIDYVVRGEGEQTLIELYRALRSGGDTAQIPNLSFRRDGKIIHNPQQPAPEFNLPFPYQLFDTGHYDLGFILSSRGCPYNCIFCSNRTTTGKRYRHKPAKDIADELQSLHDKYGRNYVLFLDDNLLVDKNRIYELLEEIKRRKLHEKMTFNFQARGDNVNPQLLSDLYQAGFRSVFFGLETASETLMKTIKKGETVAQCAAAVRMAKEAGFHVSATFIFGLPGETFTDRMAAIKLSHELKLDMVRFNNATPYPGTELYSLAQQDGGLHVKGLYENFNSVGTFVENPFKPIPFSYIPPGVTEAELRRDLLYGYFSFYFSARRLRKIFTRPDQGVGWFNAGESFWTLLKKIPALLILAFMLKIKFFQLFHYTVIKKETRISLRHFMRVFEYLWHD